VAISHQKHTRIATEEQRARDGRINKAVSALNRCPKQSNITEYSG